MLLKNRSAVNAGVLLLLIGACSACSADEAPSEELPSFNSLEEARQAVSGQLDCAEDPPPPTDVVVSGGGIPAESVKCTQTVEIFYFDSAEAREETYTLMREAAGPEGSVYFAEGGNWFVVDYSQVGVGSAEPEPRDLAALSEPLGTRFTEAK